MSNDTVSLVDRIEEGRKKLGLPKRSWTEEEKIKLPGLVYKHALRQADDAGLSPAAGKVLAYLASECEFWGTPLLKQNQIRRSQKRMSEEAGLNIRTVRRELPKVIEAGFLVDLDKYRRRTVHRYEVRLDWSFSILLSRRTPVETPEPRPVEHPKATEILDQIPKYVNGKPAGTKIASRYSGQCTRCGAEVDPAVGKKGFQVIWGKGQGSQCFCPNCVHHGVAAAKAGKPYGESFDVVDLNSAEGKNSLVETIRQGAERLRPKAVGDSSISHAVSQDGPINGPI